MPSISASNKNRAMTSVRYVTEIGANFVVDVKTPDHGFVTVTVELQSGAK
jgi:hypothetical protein